MSSEAILSVPDGEEISAVNGVLEDYELAEGEGYQLERVGFAKFEGFQDGIARLLWLHD